MTIAELLDAAKRKQGSLGVIAQRFGFHQSNLSNWRSGREKPNASQIMMLAEMAELPPFETLAKVEQQLDEKHASVWARALGNLRAAGVAATVTLGLAIYSTTPNEADAAVTNFVTPTPAQPAPAQGNGVGAVMIMSNTKLSRKHS
ncbi:transcriptional regulator [Burkholderia ambifaria]|uniref:transcriptional regulator n=1 Tax=Burkholderia ambifaria TaxID=152480 RepID=UPI000F80BB1F|nr:transcriptional regulator [Burkholderia ambifaria]WAS52786.1 transcriptional regulator [Burkholderia ambifaria]